MSVKGFDIGEALTSSFNIVLKNPKILIPQLVSSLIFTLLVNLSIINKLNVIGWFLLLPINFLILVVGFIVYLVVSGMYPLLVRDVVNSVSPNLASAARTALKKIFSLIAASILVSIIVTIGLILLIVPGFDLLNMVLLHYTSFDAGG